MHSHSARHWKGEAKWFPSPSPMIPTLPYDLWCCIASFVPLERLVKLYAVNSAFFHLALTAIYGTVNIYHVGDEATLRALLNMSPIVARLVRTLVLRPHLFGKSMPSSSNLDSSSLAEVAWNYKRRTLSKSANPPNAVAARILLRNIAQLTEVQTLTVACYPSDDWRMFKAATQFVDAAWAAHGQGLRCLTLNIPLEGLEKILPSVPTLTSLEDLSVTLRIAYLTTDCTSTLHAVATFIDRHSSTLTSLAIDTPEHKVNPAALYSNLGHLPYLAKVSIFHPVAQLSSQESTGVDAFLQKHRQGIQDLRLRFHGPPLVDDVPPTPPVLFSHPIFRVAFPNLMALDLGLCPWPTPFQLSVKEQVMAYIASLKRSLARLVIRDYVLTFDQVRGVVAVLSKQHAQLRSLQLHMYFLSCDLFDLLATKVPWLYHLELCFDSLVSKDDGSWKPNYYWNEYNDKAQAFHADIANRRYPEWALRHLTVRPLYYCSGRWDQCRKLLADSLPTVISFNGLSGDEFTEIPDYTKSL